MRALVEGIDDEIIYITFTAAFASTILLFLKIFCGNKKQKIEQAPLEEKVKHEQPKIEE